MSNNTLQKDIFISHSHKDKWFVLKLVASLEKRGISCWLDDAELDIGNPLIKSIGEGIYESAFIGAVISKNSVMSYWVQKELQLAMTREVTGQKICVLPMIIDDCTSLLPYYLRDKIYADFRNLDTYEYSIDLIIRAIENFSLKTMKRKSNLIGKINIGTIVNDRGKEYYGFRETRRMSIHGIFLASTGIISILIPVQLQKAGWVQSSKIMAISGAAGSVQYLSHI